MPQTQIKARDLITKAYQLANVVSPTQALSGPQMNDGLSYLNELLDSFASDGVSIPFVKVLTFNLVVGQDTYSISNLVSADVNYERIVALSSVNLAYAGGSYPVRVITRGQLYDNYRVTQIQSRPAYVILDRQELLTNLVFYPQPDMAYECNVRAKFMLDSLELNDTLDEIPPSANKFLRYALAKELHNVYPSQTWTPQAEQEYQKLYKMFKAGNDLDLTIDTDNILSSGYRNYGYPYYGVF